MIGVSGALSGRAVVGPTIRRRVAPENEICVRIGCGPEKRPELELRSDPSAVALGLHPKALDRISERVAEDVANEKEIFGRG